LDKGATATPAPGSAAAGGATRPPVEVILKWVAAIAAVLSLIAGSFQVTRLLSDVRERKRLIAESLDVAQRQQSGGDYVSAWTSLEAGLKNADEGGQFAKLFGQLSEERRHLRAAQEELAMVWLRDVRVPADKKFSDVVDRLLPVLDRGVGATSGGPRADRLAHIGWAYYLKVRDGVNGLDPASQYRAALQVDPGNAYAHAYWGHWIVWQNEPLADALVHFDAAVKDARLRPFVRVIELAALRLHSDSKSAAAFVHLVNEMRRNGEPVSPAVANYVYWFYHLVVVGSDPIGDLLAGMPPPEHIALLGALFGGSEVEPWKANEVHAAQAMFQEAAGDDAGALATWRAVRASISTNEISLRSRADAALRRLQAKPVAKPR
jgi:hypothetical protein